MLLTDKQETALKKYLELMSEKNKVMNLTAITDPDEMWVKHIEDSLSIIETLDELAPNSLIDVGAGAGLPGMVIKLVRDDIRVTLMDSLRKRMDFLDEVIEELGLKGAETVHARAEELAHEDYRESFDVAVSRAVARMNTLLEYALPFVRVGGHFIAMKGPLLDEELDECGHALKELGGEVCEVKHMQFEFGERNLVIIKKIKPTPKKYPRGQNKPKTKPL